MIIPLFLIFLFSIDLSPTIVELGRFGGTGIKPGQFKNPSAIDINDKGQVFICDRGNHRIQLFDLRGNFIRDIGGYGWQEERFDEPADIWARSTLNIYIADYNNHRIQRFDKDLNYINSKYSNSGDDESVQFQEVLSVIYTRQGDLFVLEGGEFKIVKFNAQDQGEIAFGYYQSGEGELTAPTQLDINSKNQILACDSELPGILIYDYFGNYLMQMTHPDLRFPVGIAVDDKNRVYICDVEYPSIFIFSANGQLLGQIKQVGGIPLTQPMDISLSRDGSEYRTYILDGDTVISATLAFK
jgi:hypothetical protein